MKISPIVLSLIVLVALGVGGVVGFLVGFGANKKGQDFLKGMVSSENKAELATPTVLTRPDFTLSYPSNWKIDSKDESYDPDHMFSIESPGSAFVMFVLGKGAADTTADDLHKHQSETFTKLLQNPTVSTFNTYGKLTGLGSELTGRVVGSKTTVRIFCAVVDGRTYMITEQFPTEDQADVKPGLALVEKSFTPKPAAKP